MECKMDSNKLDCTCTAISCSKKGICCECVKYHRDRSEIPGCFFPAEVERTWDRSVTNFIRSISKSALNY